MGKALMRRVRSTRGQSILEYLVITTVVVLAIMAIREVVQTKSNALMTEAGNTIGNAQTALQGYVVEAR